MIRPIPCKMYGMARRLCGCGLVQAGARIVPFENRSGAAFLAVSTGSAERCCSQPGMSRTTATQTKTLGPGAEDRGFL